MNLYWVYNIPNWLFAAITIFIYVIFGLIGMTVTRNIARKLHIQDHSHNDIVSYYLAAVTVFYGITLGLVAVGTWDTFSAISGKVDGEAQVLASLYRDAGSYAEPYRSELRKDLKDYTYNVVHVSWPLQRKGIVPSQSGKYLDSFQTHLMNFDSKTIRDQILQAELLKQFNVLVEYRRARLNATLTQLPSSLWALVILGGLICIVVTFFFDVKSFAMHFYMTALFAGLLGLMVFLIGTMDNPFRGSVSVKPAPLELVYHQLMQNK